MPRGVWGSAGDHVRPSVFIGGVLLERPGLWYMLVTVGCVNGVSTRGPNPADPLCPSVTPSPDTGDSEKT